MEMRQKLNETVSYLRDAGVVTPQTGIVLGTGLGSLVNEIEIIESIDYTRIPHFLLSTVESHEGRLIYGTLANKTVLVMQGRFHYYEGYSFSDITFPVRVMKALGVSQLLLSNAAGSMRSDLPKGSLMLIDDHINFLPGNPLRGVSDPELGDRFPDMSRPYSPQLNALFKQVAAELPISLKEGIYLAVMGPNLETRAEYRMFRTFADAVGMSTVPEVIVANQIKLPCAAVSVLTDECDPDYLKPVDIDDILKTAAEAEPHLTRLFKDVVARLPERG
jgi:purine-nucleoside phosphorylase